ncbi:MAG: TusE/DsrC/DsvC family sulfur relay protein [Alphaproteobacteria bacterium]|nr:TusE/DsrC/DsvC family sulfur relay protein [Alphaproteobacteria bacterium]MDE2011362.1 TusE/DsrC/DsvC family sulfur relay protein [Alphaproteobacteria bacterium]MDE2072882.1 TusE/DsrC/DsvC family sulfur relay protein [Alphaproteobacteria bacterium]MDE2353302.1 TusE/DsrC/DsvC family sulfur relay protein [Alphaproteobacteria bacterium]
MAADPNPSQINARRGPEGYLLDPASWDEQIAGALATEEDIALGDEHWRVLRFMREYWNEHQVAPDVRHVTGFLADALHVDKKIAKEQLFQLFPYGYVKQACKIAGMMRPLAWSTG